MSNPTCCAGRRPAEPGADGNASGLFEGAHYYHCGAFRPEYDCKMRELGVPFCRDLPRR